MQYEGIRQEHVAVRTSAGMFDVSHMGEIETTGPQAEQLLQRLLSNDVTRIAERGAQYSVLCRPDGGVLDDLFTYRLDGDRFLTVTNAANHERDLAWFRDHAEGFDAELKDARDDWAMLAVQGPEARAELERVTAGAAAEAHAYRGRPGRGRAVSRLRNGVYGRGWLRAHDPARRRRGGVGRAARGRAFGRPAWALATPCAWRSASTSTATTCPRTATRSRRGSAGAASSTPASSAPTRSATSSPSRCSCRLRSPGPGIPRQGNTVRTEHGEGVVTSGIALALSRDRHRDGLRADRRPPRPAPRSRWTFAARRARAEVREKPLYERR